MVFTKISRELIQSLNFRVFTKTDYYGFCDVQSPVPLIAENEDEGILMIIDGDYAELYCYDGCANFEVVDQCESIRELPIKSAVQIQIEKLESELAALKKLV